MNHSNRIRSVINQKGQSILEVAVSLGLVTLIIAILTITTINGLKNSQFAKNQVLASSYAQQGIELVKSMRQRNCPISITQGAVTETYYWYDSTKGNLIWSSTNVIPENPNESTELSFQINPATCSMYHDNTTVGGESLGESFNRKIKLEKISDSALRVTSNVIWSDFSGDHNAQNVTIITYY